MAAPDSPADDRSSALAEAFIRLTDVLGPGYDVDKALADLARTCQDVLSVDAVAVLLGDKRDHLEVAIHLPDTTPVGSLFDLDCTSGPGHQAFTTGEPVAISNLHGPTPFAKFSAAATQAGYGSAHALPMQRRVDRIGVLTLLGPVEISEAELSIARALTTMATIGILTARVYRSNLDLSQQLQAALTSRIVIEQAKGLVAAHNSGDLDAAFAVIRTAARNNNLRLNDVADAIISGELSAREMAQRQRGH